MTLADWYGLSEPTVDGDISAAVMRYDATTALLEWFHAQLETRTSYTLTQFQRLLRRRTAMRMMAAGYSDTAVLRALQLAGEPPSAIEDLDGFAVDDRRSVLGDDEAVLVLNDAVPALCVESSNDPFMNLLCAPAELRFAVLWRPRLEDILVFRSSHQAPRYLVDRGIPMPTDEAVGFSWTLAGLVDHQKGYTPAWVLPPGVEDLGVLS